MTSPLLCARVCLLPLLLLGACAQTSPSHVVSGGAKVTQESAGAHAPTTAPRRVYVQDFQLEAAAQHSSEAIERPHLIRQLLAGDPAAQSKKIVDRMATALVKDLQAAGVPAQRLEAGAPLPREGWLVRGVFTAAASGEAPRRAIIGLGTGASEMEVQVGVNDLASDPEQSFAVFGTITDPSRLPGGVVTRKPYVVAAKFVLEQGAPERDIDHTAQAIADELIKFRDQARAGRVVVPQRN